MRLIDAMRIDLDEVDISGCTDVDDIIAAVEDLIDKQPTIEAAPVVHGRWLPVEDSIFPGTKEKCSLCSIRKGTGYVYHYCPNCGARMGGDGNA